MKSSWWWKTACVALGLLVSTYFLLPSLYELSKTSTGKTWEEFLEKHEKFASYLPKEKIKLGLDLQGGIHLVLSVDVDKFISSEIDKNTTYMQNYLKNKDIANIKATKSKDDKIFVSVGKADDLDRVRAILKEDYYGRFILNEMETEAQDGNVLVYDTVEDWVTKIKTEAVTQALETIRNRIDQFNVSEPNITPMGANRILIQLPGMKDPERALAIIRRTALLEFKLVDKAMGQAELLTMIAEAVSSGELPKEYTPAEANQTLSPKLPENTEILFEVETDPTTQEQIKRPYLIQKTTVLTGDVLEDARVRTDQSNFNQPYVSLQMNERGAEIFEAVTTENVGEQLAIVLDNRIASAPVIQEKISRDSAMNGQVSITLGRMSKFEEQMKEAEDLVIVLRAGSLPAPVEVEENRSVGPSLGRDSINSGLFAMLLSMILVIAFMIIYYRLSGIVADIVLFLNIIFILSILALLQATLTLPGIAGIVLTIGMAVDANVLIFERIREELRLGKTPRASIDAGFTKAHLTILDANVTTVIAGIVLLQYGTGPIQGFAVVLIIGIASSYLTAMWISKLIFEYFYTRRSIKKMSI